MGPRWHTAGTGAPGLPALPHLPRGALCPLQPLVSICPSIWGQQQGQVGLSAGLV